MIDIGSHVVCVKKDWEAHIMEFENKYKKKFFPPKEGQVYTIRDIRFHPVVKDFYVRLEEIINPFCKTDEPGYHIDYFRPLKKLKVEDFMKVKLGIDEYV